MQKDIHPAVGTFDNKAEHEFYLNFAKLFKVKGPPKSGDWLSSHKEVPQAFKDYTQFNKLTKERGVIYIQPFGKFSQQFLQKLQTFCSFYYLGAQIKVQKEVEFASIKDRVKSREGYESKQYLAQDILAVMRGMVPTDAYCVMGITLEDIYPGENWNFVYGWAMYKARVGIFSFIRWDEDAFQDRTREVDWGKILHPSLRTMVHEIGHMFYITHCVFYDCLMNGFNHIDEHYRYPLEFCPVCFRKILGNVEFDLPKRYELLIGFLQKHDIAEREVELYRTILKHCLPKGKLPFQLKPLQSKPLPSKPQSIQRKVERVQVQRQSVQKKQSKTQKSLPRQQKDKPKPSIAAAFQKVRLQEFAYQDLGKQTQPSISKPAIPKPRK